MPEEYDVVIAGAGLAGACAAFHLAQSRRVLVLEAEEPAAGASGIAAGTANPLMSLWARPVWRMEEAMNALEALLAAADAADLPQRDGLLRPAADARQAQAFARVADELPEHAAWLTEDDVAARFPPVWAPFGALWNGTAMMVPISELVRRLLDKSMASGAEVRTGSILMGWRVRADGVDVEVRAPRTSEPLSSIRCRKLLLTLGRQYNDFPELSRLRLHQVKGQLVRVARPAGLDELPHLAGRGYIVVEGESLLLGSTYEHQFCSLDPDPHKTQEIIRITAEMVPALESPTVLEELAGVRVTVPGIRLPMLGPLPDTPNVWIFTGLGSKGLLMAPMLAREMRRFFENPGEIPAEVRVRMARDEGAGRA